MENKGIIKDREKRNGTKSEVISLRKRTKSQISSYRLNMWKEYLMGKNTTSIFTRKTREEVNAGEVKRRTELREINWLK